MKNRSKLIIACSILGVSCLCAFCLLTVSIPFFPNISKIIEIKQAQNKYTAAANELCKDSLLVKDLHDFACQDSIYLQDYNKYNIAPRKVEKVTLDNASRIFIYKSLVLRVDPEFDFPCPDCNDIATKNAYNFAFQIGNSYIGLSSFNIREQNTIIDLNEDLSNIQAIGNRYIWILFYNPNIIDTYQLFSVDKTTNKVESLAVPIKLDEKATDFNLDPNNLKISYKSNNENKSISVDLDASTEVLADFGSMYPLRDSTGITINSDDYKSIAKMREGYSIYSFKIKGEPEGAVQPYILNYSIVPTNSVFDDPNLVTTLPEQDNFSGLKKIGITYEDLKIILNNLPTGQKVFWGKQDFNTTKDYKFTLPFEKSIRELENICRLNSLVCNFKFN